MKKRHKRLIIILFFIAIISIITGLVLNVFRSNLVFFHTPTEVSEGNVPYDRMFRIGGIVQEGSVLRDEDSVFVNFIVTDRVSSINVKYSGILPDLFKEGKGVVVQGKINKNNVMMASIVLAKHDENYMPPEAAEAMERAKKSIIESQKSLINN